MSDDRHELSPRLARPQTSFVRETEDLVACLAALHKRRQDLEGYLEAVPDGVVVVNMRTGIIQYVNEATEILSGYPREEILSRPVEILVPRELREIHRHHRENYAIHPNTRPMGLGMDLHLKHQAGTLVPVTIALKPMRSGDDVLIVAAIRERK